MTKSKRKQMLVLSILSAVSGSTLIASSDAAEAKPIRSECREQWEQFKQFPLSSCKQERDLNDKAPVDPYSS